MTEEGGGGQGGGKEMVCSGETPEEWNLPCVEGESHWKEVWVMDGTHYSQS